MLRIIETAAMSSPTWPTLEAFVRSQVQRCLQQVLEEEVDAVLGRQQSERRSDDAAAAIATATGSPATSR